MYQTVLYYSKAKILGDNLKKWREEMGLSQIDLAKEINVTREAISKWERGLCLPDWTSIFILSQIMGLTLNDLFENGKEDDFLSQYSKCRTEEIIEMHTVQLLKTDDPDGKRLKENVGILAFYTDRLDDRIHFAFITKSWIRASLMSHAIESVDNNARTINVRTAAYEYIFFEDDDLLNIGDKTLLLLDSCVLKPDNKIYLPIGTHFKTQC